MLVYTSVSLLQHNTRIMVISGARMTIAGEWEQGLYYFAESSVTVLSRH